MADGRVGYGASTDLASGSRPSQPATDGMT